jgi:hypothetical protein
MKLVKEEESMSKRWFPCVLIFALGCASLATNAMAQKPQEGRGVLEDGLSYIMTGSDVSLINTGRDVYVVMVQRAPGTSPVEAPISYMEGVVRFSGFSLNQAILFRLQPVAVLEDEFWRPCAMGDCSFIGPLPPPPPPTAPPDPTAIFLQPQPQ